MARLVEETIINEDDTTVTIRFTRRDGRYMEKTYTKPEGVDTETMLKRAHRLVTLQVLQNRLRASEWTVPVVTE